MLRFLGTVPILSAVVIFSAVLGVSVAAPSIASADLAAQARFHHQQARNHYVARHYEAALEEFFSAQRIAPSPGTLFNIARCFERLHRDEETYLFYSQYLASDDDNEELRRNAQGVITRLDESVARIRVITTPPGADVFVDQRDRGRYGRTPMVAAVPAGTRQITAALEGYVGASAEVEAVAGQEVEVRLELEQILGGLVVRGPASGTYTVRDDEGSAVAEGALGERVSLPPSRYVIEVESEGHRPWRSIALVEANEDQRVVAEPEPLPPPSGAITVTANHSGALVRIDGEPAGFAPLALPSVPVGEHSVVISYAGVRPWEGTVSVEADERAWVTASLTPPATTERSPLTWVSGGLGVASLLAAGILAGVAADNHSQYEAELGASPDPNTIDQLRSDGMTLNVASDVMFAVGAVGLGGAVLLFVFTESTEDEPSSAAIAREAR